MSQWGGCVGCPWHDTPVREHSKTATSGYRRDMTYPDRAPLKEVLGGQYNYREGGRQVLRQGAKGRRRSRKCQCSKDPCAQKVSGGRTDPSPKYRWKVHG